MAKEEEKVQNGGSSGGSSGSSSGGITGSISRGSSSGSSKSSKVSSGSSVSRSSGKSFEGKGSSISNKPVSKAGQNVRAALQFGRSRTGSSQASSTAASPLTHYSRQGNGPSRYDPSIEAQEKIDERNARLNSEASAAADEANFLAEASGGKHVNANDTFYGKAVADTANELINRWNKGEAVTAAVENGNVVVRNEENDVNRKHYWVDVDENGNDVATQNPERQRQNDEMFAQDVQGLFDLFNSGNYTKADVRKAFIGIKKWELGQKDGTWVPSENTLKADTFDQLYDMRDKMLENADRRDAAQILNDLSFKQQDLFNGLQQGASIPASVYKQGMDEIAAYAKQYSGYEDISNLFTDMQTWYANAYNRAEVRELKGQLEGLNDAVTKTQSAAATAEQNINWYQFGGDSGDGITLDDLKARQAEADAAFSQAKADLDSTNARIAQLDEEYRSQNMTPEIEEALKRLSIPQLGKAYSTEDIEKYIEETGTFAAFGDYKGVAEQMRREDQQLVDDWNMGLNLNPQYYNWQDRLGGIGKSFGARTLGSAANIAAWTVGATTYDNEEVRQADQAYNAAERDWLTNPTPENKAAMDAAEMALQDAQNRVATGEAERTTSAVSIEQFADRLDEQSQLEIQKAKEGLSKGGQFWVDLGSTGLDMGLDAFTGGGLYTMFARVAGQGIGEARRAGATSGQQLLYGAATGAVEVLTEKLTDGLGFIYGKGISTDVVEKAISRLSSSNAGANFLRLLAGAVGEGGEEVLSDLANPFIQWIIDENARDNRTYDVDLSELLYDFLLGGAMGLIGQGVEIRNGGYAEKNAEIAKNDAEIIEKAENAEATGQQLTKGELKDLGSAQAREEQRSIKGAVQVNPNGSVAVNQVSGKGKNRHEKITDQQVAGIEATGYGSEIQSKDEAYETSTSGMTEEERRESPEGTAGKPPAYTDEDAPPENTKGGDAWVDEDSSPDAEEVGEAAPEKTPSRGVRGPDTVETKDKAEADIVQKMGDNNSLDVPSYSTGSIQDLWARQEARLNEGKKMTRDAEFEKYYDKDGKELTLQQAAQAEKNGEDVTRVRTISKDTLTEMDKATPEKPLVFINNYKGQITGFKWDGTNLWITHAASDGKQTSIGDANRLHAGQFERAAVYLSQVMSGMSGREHANYGYKRYSGGDPLVNTLFNQENLGKRATATETAQGEEQGLTQAQTLEQPQEPVKLEGNAQGEVISNTASTTTSESGIVEQADIDEEATESGNSGQSLGGSVSGVEEGNAGGTETENSEGQAAHGISSHVRGEGSAEKHKEELTKFENAGGKAVERENWTQDEIEAEKLAQKLGISGITIIDSQGKQMPRNGVSIRNYPGAGIFVVRRNTGDAKADAVNFRRTVLHESMHNRLAQLRLSGGFKKIAEMRNAIQRASQFSPDKYARALSNFEDLYAPSVIGVPEHFASYLEEDKAKWYSQQSSKDLDRLEHLAEEELLTHLFAGQRQDAFGISAFDDLVSYCRSEAAHILFDGTTGKEAQRFIEGIYGEADSELTDVAPATKETVPHTSGTAKKSQSAYEQDITTKGERAGTDENAGEATFTSRTNADRSITANHLTDTQKKRDAQAQRLLKEGYSWTDDDVVIAQKLMWDMVKSIRDYQLGMRRKINPAGYKHLTQQYNALNLKHQKMLSEAGQKLQANYEFTVGEKIVQKAAKTFLGFTEDGRFAGESPNAKNAKIYRAVEDAAGRIDKAVKAKDAKAVAKICQDISTIRNTKKMFGPLGNFAANMEKRVLDNIATEKNGLEALETLAYGNLNAMTDDVQPYKPINAIKTIRVMNMLSNMATIMNNIGNNIGQGFTSTNFIGQAATQLAGKQFEKLTGSPVISKQAKGWVANKEIRTAELEALEMATLGQMYGISYENGRLELNDQGMFNPNANAFEQTMGLYKFLIGMGVEATDKVKAAGLLKSMEMGIDEDIAAGKISPEEKERRLQEARHEVNRLLYKDDNKFTAFVQHARDFLNSLATFGNKDVGTIGLGDIAMAFAKIPANVVKARLSMTPEGALYNVVSYAKGVAKAKQMHSEVLAKNIAESDMSDSAKWAAAKEQCSGAVYKKLTQIRNNYAQSISFDHAVERAGYMNATEMSQFEMAQNARKIGRAATSAGMIALGAVLRSLGALRDFDEEPDKELRKMNSEKGYRGLMLNFSAMGRKNHEWKDGDFILDAEWLECIAMPLAIGATAAECAANEEDAKAWSFFKSMGGDGLTKAFEAVGDIPGMADAINLYDSFNNSYTTDDSKARAKLGSGILNYAANTIPSFFMPNAISQATAGLGNTVRDVYTADNAWEQAWNIFANKIPGLRQKIPASVDVWGNERKFGENRLMGLINKSLLPGDAFIFHKSKYEEEIERLVRAGYTNSVPKTTVSGSFEVGDETYTLIADEKREFKSNRNTAQALAFEKFMGSEWYDQLNDAQRMKVFKALKTDAERDAKQVVLNDRNAGVDVGRDKWEEDLKTLDDQIEFLSAKQLAEGVWDKDEKSVSDYAEMDNYLGSVYKNLDETQRELLNSTYSQLDSMYEAKTKYGIGSEMYQKGYDIYNDYNSQEGKDRVEGGYKGWEATQMWTDIANKTGASEKQMKFFEDNMKLYNHIAADSEKYHVLVDDGWDRNASQGLVKTIADLQPTNGRKTVSYKQRLTAIAGATGASDEQKWEAFFEYCPSSYTSVIRTMSRYRDKGYSYERALKAAGKWDK